MTAAMCYSACQEGLPQLTADPTTCFINLLRECAFTNKLTIDEFRTLQESAEPYKPSLRAISPEQEFAFNKGFEYLLARKLDWNRIRIEAAKLEGQLVKQHELRRYCRNETRHLVFMSEGAWGASVPTRLQQWVRQWEASWSSRNIEHLMCFFTGDVTYSLDGIDTGIHGKSNVRRLFSKLLHTGLLTMRVREVLVDVSEGEVLLKWVRSSLCATRHVTGTKREILIGGQSTLKVDYPVGSLKVQDSISKCVDSWDSDDLTRLVLGSPAMTTLQHKAIVKTTTDLIFPSGFRLSRNPSPNNLPVQPTEPD
jgi:hypothetical protein